jgi:hypothetical protein
MIKYHQNGIGNEYGEDHMLTNNWNAEADYGNEYTNVHFRIEAKNYQYPYNNFNEETRKLFYTEAYNAMESLGWVIEREGRNGSCTEIRKGKAHLYLHPQDFSGEVLKNDVKQIAEALEKHNEFYLRWVDLYDTVYDITDNEYEEYLNTRNDDIYHLLFKQCETSRITKFYYTSDRCGGIAERIKLKRIGLKDGRNYEEGQTMEHIGKIAEKMISEGYLVSAENGRLIRSINKTEQKKLKLQIV